MQQDNLLGNTWREWCIIYEFDPSSLKQMELITHLISQLKPKKKKKKKKKVITLHDQSKKIDLNNVIIIHYSCKKNNLFQLFIF